MYYITCFDEHSDLAFHSIPGYTLISDAYRISSHCGVAIYLNNDFSYERKFINNKSAVFESMAIEIWKNDTITNSGKYLIISVYRPPSVLVDTLISFIGEFTSYLDDVQKVYRKAYICGDININLLKIHENNHYNSFYENITSNGFMPQITLPTRLSNTCNTLIDNIFTNNFEKNHKNLILTRTISDHQMTCCMLPNHNVINPVNRNYIEVETINEKTLGQFKNALTSTNIHEKMNHAEYANPNENYQILINILSKAKEIYMHKTTRRYNKRKDKKEKWMTNELLQQINKKNDMYVDWKTKSTTTEMYNHKKINFKTFEKIVNINIAETKRIYYHNTFQNYKNNVK